TARFVVQDGEVKGITVETSPEQVDVATCMRILIVNDNLWRKTKAVSTCAKTFTKPVSAFPR
ncbi:MAG: hypothetical protein ABI175_20390, partial [Polyangiales bacterium]